MTVNVCVCAGGGEQSYRSMTMNWHNINMTEQIYLSKSLIKTCLYSEKQTLGVVTSIQLEFWESERGYRNSCVYSSEKCLFV